ncbi:hypothetical protein CAJAP_09020 [Camponotus japonicus]
MNEVVAQQQSLFHSVSRSLDNLKKIGRNNYYRKEDPIANSHFKRTVVAVQSGSRYATAWYSEGKTGIHLLL